MTNEEFNRIAKFLKSTYGIDMAEKKEIVKGRLDNYIRAGGWSDYTSYMNAVEKDSSGKLEKELVNMLTTNHTYFMREFEHFDFLKQEVLPWLKQKEQRTRDLSIWCGAASSGEEPYMLAMLMKDFFGLEHESWDTTVLATDISTEVLQKAQQGIYKQEQINILPDTWKRRFLNPLPDGMHYQMTPEIKKEVLFRQFNLMDNFPFRRKMHIVFLRNVMIYFDKETKRQLVQKVYNTMHPGAYFFIGRTEALEKGAAPFEMIQPSIFRKPL
ncbi:MAG: chemotaxis protein CheR [Lachnospiraceae bacterium]|nr:chemotaxis protein CheR [Lachnospiraceae bacterium]